MINILDCPYPDLAPIFSLVRYLISIVSVVVPIILIVLGIIDFSKAVIAKDEKDMKASQSIFIKRVIYAVAIFFVYTLVVFITNLIAKYFPDEGATSWIDCFGSEDVSNSVQCNNSADCASGEFCNTSGQCQVQNSCNSFGEGSYYYNLCNNCESRGGNWDYVKNICLTNDSCGTDSECDNGYYCNDNNKCELQTSCNQYSDDKKEKCINCINGSNKGNWSFNSDVCICPSELTVDELGLCK